MKILFINTGPWGTGSFTGIKGLSKQLIKFGHEVKIFFPDTGLPSDDKAEYYGHPDIYYVWKFPISNGQLTLSTFPLMLTEPHPRNPHPILFCNMSDPELDFYKKALKQAKKFDWSEVVKKHMAVYEEMGVLSQ